VDIGKYWRIESDSSNVMLQKRQKDDSWNTEGYYSSVANALKALVDKNVKATELKDVNTVVKTIAEVQTWIMEALQGNGTATTTRRIPKIDPKGQKQGKSPSSKNEDFRQDKLFDIDF